MVPGKSRKWNANWIWDAKNPAPTNSYYYFRKTFYRHAEAGPVRVFITADSRYQLFINGELVGRGAPQSQPFLHYYDEYEEAESPTPGTHCLAVLVNYTGIMDGTRGGLLLEVVDMDGNTVVGTDESWRFHRARAWQSRTHRIRANRSIPYQEFFDARMEPRGWRNSDFDDSSWSKAAAIQGRFSARPPAVLPWGRLVPRDIPHMYEEAILPVRVERVEESLDLANRSRANDLAPSLSMVGRELQYTRVDRPECLCDSEGDTVIQGSTAHLDLDFDGVYSPAVVLDFGRVVTARTILDITASAGCAVEIGYAERLIDGYFNIAMECEFADRYTTRSGRQTFEAFWWKAFRYMKLRFRNCQEPVTVHEVAARISTYPYKEKGGFSSNDETLNGVFDISRYTVRLCSNEFLMDTPWREQAQWLGDVALVTVPAIHSCFGDSLLTGKFLRQAAENRHQTGLLSNVSNQVNHSWQSAIPDYSLWWIGGLLEQYLFTGEEYWIHAFYPQAVGIIQAHLNHLNDRGLIEDMPYWVFVDWADVDKRGECAAFNAIFYGALQAILPMAELKGDSYMVNLVRETMEKMEGVFQQHFFDPERGCFADAVIDGEFSPRISEHANFAAVRYGLCDDATAQSLINAFFVDRTITGATEAQPFFMTVVLAALDRAGRTELALELIRERWGKRMLDKGCTSVLEEWYENGSWRDGDFKGFLRSHSHAWSACPADFLIRALIGLEILEPGCARVRIAATPTQFDYDVSFPTPHGSILVRNIDGEFTAEVPADVEVAE